MSFTPFDIEVIQSKWEQRVEFNLVESGVHPLRLEELLGFPGSELEVGALLATELNYPHVNGIPALRENIARLYPVTSGAAADIDNVLVTVGASEANNIIMQTLMEPGDELLTQTPTYMQLWGMALNTGHTVKTFGLQADAGWALDLEALNNGLSSHTKIIAVCNPNNPTGHIMTEAEMDAVVEAADRVGAWIVADEVYRGAERLREDETPSFYGRYDKVLCLGSLSKAYGLPGLRIGWITGSVDTIEALWRRHEYTTVSTTILSNKLAALALSPAVRPQLIRRTRDYVRRGFPVLEAWMQEQAGLFSYTPPQASAITFIRYHLDINSTQLMEQLCRETGVFVGAGDAFGMDHYLRVAFGQDKAVLEEAFARISRVLHQLQAA
ncbi:MAG: aminotransferase class I/II-fold pyridoxal phosphate-dependent enzyme [Candidatus Thiothrix singaporensis]|uniref:Aminotransferase n=1 Tax=Candidatus Thiothrix singaporensis TaxID=2799669 RepID=A0A7L6AQD1_9GAMM|nr:MAG: aminotransferase class I/II-fold pyridoxal phosphate-dependent enzyme [Candidatus Thiothrix singaporensis]